MRIILYLHLVLVLTIIVIFSSFAISHSRYVICLCLIFRYVWIWCLGPWCKQWRTLSNSARSQPVYVHHWHLLCYVCSCCFHIYTLLWCHCTIYGQTSHKILNLSCKIPNNKTCFFKYIILCSRTIYGLPNEINIFIIIKYIIIVHLFCTDCCVNLVFNK